MKRRLFPAAFKKLVAMGALKGMEEVFKDRRIDRARHNEQGGAEHQQNQGLTQ